MNIVTSGSTPMARRAANRMIRLSPVLLWGAALCLPGMSCISTEATRLGNAPYRAPVPVETVAIYRTAKQVPGKYEEVALLMASGDSEITSTSQMHSALKKRAAELGCNGIILDGTKEPGAGAKLESALLGTSAERKGKAIAIYVFPK